MIRAPALAALLLIAASPAHSRDGWAEHPVCDAATVAGEEIVFIMMNSGEAVCYFAGAGT